jgi:16S rRNA (guanine1516-N2)-methyltransferase
VDFAMTLTLQSSSDLQDRLGTEIQKLRQSSVVIGEKSDLSREWLQMTEGKLTLRHPLGELSLDFLSDSRYQRRGHRGKNELIAKALGSQRGVKQVFDATLGLAEDALFLSQLGFEVTGCERSPWIYLLLKDAENRARQDQPEFSLKVSFGSAPERFAEMRSRPFSERPAMIYLDPMFPEKRKTALPRKEMQIFREIVGEDDDAALMLAEAMKTAREGVVAKRPLKAPALQPVSGKAHVTHSFEGKTVRYDLYSVK